MTAMTLITRLTMLEVGGGRSSEMSLKMSRLIFRPSTMNVMTEGVAGMVAAASGLIGGPRVSGRV